MNRVNLSFVVCVALLALASASPFPKRASCDSKYDNSTDLKPKEYFWCAKYVNASGPKPNACFCTCPSNADPNYTNKYFSTKPASYIGSINYGSEKNACCRCADDCKNQSGCTFNLCGKFPDYDGQTTNCQLYTDDDEVPDTTVPKGSQSWWSHICSPCT